MSECAHPEPDLLQLHDGTTHLCRVCGVEGYLTKKGRILTNEDIERLAEEAERGYDVEHLRE